MSLDFIAHKIAQCCRIRFEVQSGISCSNLFPTIEQSKCNFTLVSRFSIITDKNSFIQTNFIHIHIISAIKQYVIGDKNQSRLVPTVTQFMLYLNAYMYFQR